MELHAFPLDNFALCFSIYQNIFCRFLSENTWIRGVPRRECSPLCPQEQHPLWREHPSLIQEEIRIWWLPRSQGRISLCLRKKVVTCPFHGLLLSNEPQLISAQPAKSCSFRQRQLLCWQAFLQLFPSFLWSQWPKLPLVVPRQQIMSPATSCLLHSSLLNSQHQEFGRIMCGFVWYYWGFLPHPKPIRFIFHLRVCLPRMFLQNMKLFTSKSFYFFPQALLMVSVSELMSLSPPASQCEHSELCCCWESSGSPRLFPDSIIGTEHTLVAILIFLSWALQGFSPSLWVRSRAFT